jgi:hypothetical protein
MVGPPLEMSGRAAVIRAVFTWRFRVEGRLPAARLRITRPGGPAEARPALHDIKLYGVCGAGHHEAVPRVLTLSGCVSANRRGAEQLGTDGARWGRSVMVAGEPEDVLDEPRACVAEFPR